MSGIRILAIVVAAIVYFFIGAIWYGQFSVAWLAGIGRTMAELEAENPGARPYVVGFASVLVACATLGWLIARTGATGWAAARSWAPSWRWASSARSSRSTTGSSRGACRCG